MIEDPHGWLEIDERSVVSSVAPNVPVKDIIAETSRPAVVIWRGLNTLTKTRECYTNGC